MQFDLTADDFGGLLAAASDDGLPAGVSTPWPARLGRGRFEALAVRPGIVAYVMDFEPVVSFSIQSTPGGGYLGCSYHLAGRALGTIDGLATPIDVSAGQQMALLAPVGHGGRVCFESRQPLRTVAVCVTPSALNELFPRIDRTRVESWHRAVDDAAPLVERPRPLGDLQRQLAHDLLVPRYTGTAGRLLSESHVLELLAHEVGTEAGAADGSFEHEHETRMHHAAAIIRQRLDDPPTLQQLARAVGTNEFLLKRTFKKVFGTTVFGYLRACRMQTAHELLQARATTVADAAVQVGYVCPSRFAAAFRREFGVAPSAVRQAGR